MSYSKRFGTQGKANKGSVFTQQFSLPEVGVMIATSPSGNSYRRSFPTGAEARRLYLWAREKGCLNVNLDAGWEKV